MSDKVSELKVKLNSLYCELEDESDELSRAKMRVDTIRENISFYKDQIEDIENELISLGVEVESDLLLY